ncbi:hypothetical protein FO519_003942 [Halicephalobus sp. NKZ332]|nr:hypothetical protein FO519_003942 [Halicephalobus sp. NKZ332]
MANGRQEELPDETTLHESLRDLFLGNSSNKPPPKKLVIVVKSEVDRCKITMERPVKLRDLEDILMRRYRMPLNIFHSNISYDYLQKINSQSELDNLVQLHDMRNRESKFRLTVSPKEEEDVILKPDSRGVYRVGDFINDMASDTATSAKTNVVSGRIDLSRLGNLPELPERRPPEEYKEGAKIGTGAHGSVYVCYDFDTGEKLVLKKIFARGDANAVKIKMDSLTDEVGLLSRLSHENIVQYRGAVVADNFVLIFMEFMTGGSLYDVIREAGTLPPRQAIDTTRQVLSGLAYLHDLGIIHRDIKSANIMRTAQVPVVVKIGDFGSAQFLRALASLSSTDYQGTPHYTAPEIFRRSRPYDEKADIWSVGITVIEMLTGRTPYANFEPAVLFYKMANEDKIEYDIPRETPGPLANVISRMLVWEPSKRPTANDLLSLEIFRNRPITPKTSLAN